MEEDQLSHSTTAKKWERPWNTSDIRENSANWTLAGDTGLLNFLQEYAHNLISRTHETEKLVNELVYKNKAISAKVNNVINDFQMLSNEQFIENRVYDEEIEDAKPSENVPELQKTKEQREAEMIPRVTQALDLGLSVLDQAFHKVQVEETSDSEEDECRVEELEPKDPYEHRPLPFIIGSHEFHQDDFVGLRDLYVEEFVETQVDEESVSVASLSSSSLDESDVEIESPYARDTATPKDYAEDIVPPKNLDRPNSTASDSSDLFDMEKEENDDFTSNLMEEEKTLKENEQNKRLNTDDLVKEVKSVIRHKIEPDVAKVSQPPKQEKYDDLFGSIENDNIEENSPFQKKPGGLFSTDLAFTNGKDDASDDDDLFGTSEKNQVISSKTEPAAPPAVASSKETKAPDLFGESDDENEDIFATLSSKKPFSISQPTTTAIKKDEHNVAPKTTDSFTSVPEATKKKSNNAFPDFAVQSSSDSDSLFGDAPAMDDLFITKPEKKLSAGNFMANDEDENDLFSSLKTKSSDSVESKKKEVKVEQSPQQSKKLESSLFGGDDDDDEGSFDLFKSSTKRPYTSSSSKMEAPDLFGSGKVLSSKSTEPSKEVLSPKEDLFEEDTSKSTTFAKKTHAEILNTTKETYAKNTVPVKESTDYSSKISSRTSLSSGNKIPNKMLSTAEDEVDVSVSFDEPVDAHSTLNVINKGRAKIPGKRRKPTRKARQGSLITENADSEVEESRKTSVVRSSPLIQNDQVLSDGSDLFESTPSDVKSSESEITPKKLAPYGINKNIMSQLVSEISNSKVGKRDFVSKKHDSFEDDSGDDFFSPTPSSKSGSQTSDFLQGPPKKETVVESSHAPPTKKVGANVKDSDSSLEDDLFSEPAFKGFSSSIPENDSIFNMDDDEDIFKIVDANKQKTSIPSGESSDDIFALSEEDIFAGVGREKYELISSQLYDDNDDIFGNLDAPVKQTTSGSNTKKSSKVEAPKKEPVDIFDDPLTGFSSE